MTVEKSYKYEMVLDNLRSEIGEMEFGEKMKSRNELAKQFGVSRVTIEKAVAQLVKENVLRSVKGSGSFVNSDVDNTGPIEFISHTSVTNLRTIALLIGSITHDIYPYILRGVEDIANEHRINILICNTDHSIAKQDAYLNRLLEDGVDGIIIAPSLKGMSATAVFEKLKKNNVPVVCCYRNVPGIYTSGVYCNNFQAGYLATKRLVESGCKKIAYISPPVYETAIERYKGYTTALQENKLDFDEKLVVYDSAYSGLSIGEEVALKLLIDNPGIDGIFAFNDRIAAGAYKSIIRLNMIPGKEIKVIGCDNTEMCASLSVPLTSVYFPVYDLGKHAMEMLLEMDRSRASGTAPQIKIFSPQIAVRQSCP